MRLRTILIGTVVVVVGVVVAAVAIVANMDFSQYKGLIAQKTKEATGRDLEIKGDLSLVVGLSPSLAVSDVSFANAPWGSRPQMVTVKRLETQVDLIPLLSGDIRVKRLVLIEPDILLETDKQGRGNWEFETTGTPKPAQPTTESGEPINLPEVHAVEIRNAKLVHRDGQTNTATSVALTHALLSADSESAPLQLDVAGAFNDLRFQVAGQVGSVAALGSPGTAFPVNVTARIADAATLKIDGQVREPLAGKGYDLRVTAEAAEIARVAALGGVTLPPLGPLKADLRVNDAANGNPSLPQINATAGKPELAVVKVEGSVRDVIGQKGVALTVQAEGREIGAFSGLALPGAAPLPEIPALGPFKLTARTGSGAGERLSLPNVRLELGRDDLLKASVDGSIQDPLAGKGYSLNLAANAPDLKAVATALKTTAPLDGPLSLRGRIADAGPQRYALSNFKVEAAGSDLSGEGALSLAGGKPAITGNFASTLVDLEKLLPKGGDSAAPQGGGAAGAGGSAGRNDGRVFPADPLPLDGLNAADAELRYRAASIRGGGVPPLANVSLQGSLKGGALAVRPITAEIGGGKVNGELSLAAATGALSLKLTASDVELGTIDEMVLGREMLNGGKTDVEIDLRSTGQSVRALMAGLDGSIFVHVDKGQVKGRLGDAIGLGELVQIISRSLPEQETTPYNCVVSKLDFQKGMATARGFVVDSPRLTLDGSGTVNLATEQPSLLFNSHTKVPNLLSVLPPIRVSGTLANPRFLPDVGAAATGLVGDVVGTVLGTPGNVVGAITGTITGRQRPQTDICAQALARATGRAAPASQPQPGQIPPRDQQQSQQPRQQQQQQQPANPIDEIQRGIRGLFGR